MRRGKKVAERITKETTTDEIVGLIVGSLPGDYRDENDEAKVIAEVGKETSSVNEGQEGKQEEKSCRVTP